MPQSENPRRGPAPDPLTSTVRHLVELERQLEQEEPTTTRIGRVVAETIGTMTFVLGHLALLLGG